MRASYEIPDKALARFEEKFIPEPNSGCWLWTGSDNGHGYGGFSLAGRGGLSAHRAAWILYRTSIPHGLFVCHKCDVRCCVNPDHLFLGTHRDNVEDCRAKGRYKNARKTHCVKGHKLSGDNIWKRRGRRYCKECHRQRLRRTRAETKARAALARAQGGDR